MTREDFSPALEGAALDCILLESPLPDDLDEITSTATVRFASFLPEFCASVPGFG